MIDLSLLKEAKVTEVLGATVANTTTIPTAEVDMSGYENVVFLCSLGTSAADNGMKVQQDTVTGMGSAADLLGSSVLCNGTGKVVMTEIVKPRERFVRGSVLRGTSTTINSVFAIQFGKRSVPHNNSVTNVQNAEVHVSPAEGTA
jgi:hypothetical protein